MAQVRRLTNIADLTLGDVLEQVKRAPLLPVVSNCSISAAHLHVTALTFARIPERPIGTELVSVSVRRPTLSVKSSTNGESAGVLIPPCRWPP
jgi:hypothetical protein